MERPVVAVYILNESLVAKNVSVSGSRVVRTSGRPVQLRHLLCTLPRAHTRYPELFING